MVDLDSKTRRDLFVTSPKKEAAVVGSVVVVCVDDEKKEWHL